MYGRASICVTALGAAGGALYLRSQAEAAARRVAAARAASAAVDLRGRRALVVGGTSGIGHGIALRLAEAGASVTIVGRSEGRGAAIVEELRVRPTTTAGAKGDFDFAPLDAMSLPACASFAEEQLASGRPVDMLLLTQGMATFQGYTPTPAEKGGLDEKLTVHYFSRMMLARRLAPLLSRSSDGRVLSVFSAGVHGSYAGYDKDFELRSSYSTKNCADAAGLYMDIGMEALSEEFPSVSFVHSAPGFIATNWGTEMNPVVRGVIRLLQRLARSKEDCGEFMFRALFLDDLRGGGFFQLSEFGERIGKLAALHLEAKDSVWRSTLTHLDKYR